MQSNSGCLYTQTSKSNLPMPREEEEIVFSYMSTFVVPTLLYGVETWGSSLTREITRKIKRDL